MKRRPAHTDRGETLLELLITVMLLGVTVVALVGGLGTAVRASDIHRKQATAGLAVRDYAEGLQNWVTAGHYTACATTASFAGYTGYTAPTGYTTSVVAGSLRYWSGTAWQATCGTDQGLQRLTVQVASSDGRAAEQVVLVVRKRCGTADALCS